MVEEEDDAAAVAVAALSLAVAGAMGLGMSERGLMVADPSSFAKLRWMDLSCVYVCVCVCVCENVHKAFEPCVCMRACERVQGIYACVRENVHKAFEPCVCVFVRMCVSKGFKLRLTEREGVKS